MKRIKSILSFGVAMTLSVGLFAGCAGNDEPEKSAAAQAEEIMAEQTYDYTGEAPITDEADQSVSFLAQNSWYSTVDYAKATVVQEVAKRANVTVDWTLISPTNYKDSVSPILASGTDLQDIVMLTDLDPNMKMISAGLWLPLDEYLDEMPNYSKFLDENPSVKASLTAEDGHIYYVPQMVVTDNYQPCAMINVQWLDRLGLEVPSTIDELVTVLRTFRDEDANGNGDPSDEIPMSLRAQYIPYLFGPAFGLDMVDGFYADEDGTVHYAYTDSEKYKNYITFLHDLYEEGLIEVEFTSLSRDQITERCAQDITGLTFDFSWQMSQLYSAQSPDYTGEEGIFVGIPPISGEYEGYYLARNPISNIFGVSAKGDNPILAIRFLDYAISEESQNLYVWGIEGESYVVNEDGSKSFTEAAQDSTWVQNYGINPGCYPSQQSVAATDVLLPAWHVAVDKELANYMHAPWPFIYSTSEEANIVSQYLVDIQTYVDEKNIAFITGTSSLDEFDNFLSTLESMNVGEVLKVKQAQYDRFKSAK